MPNWCSYIMGIGGKPENVEKLYNILNWDADPNANESDPHMPKISCTDIVSDHVHSDDWRKLVIEGECQWSVGACMFDYINSYYRKWKDKLAEAKANNDVKTINELSNIGYTTIDRLSKDLNLTIEIYSTESGMGFCEYYLLKDGEIIEDEEGWYETVCIDEYETYDDYIADCTEAPMCITRYDFEKAVEAGDSFIDHAEYQFLDIIPDNRPLKFKKPKLTEEETEEMENKNNA